MRNFDAAGEQVKNTQTTSRQRFDLPGEPVWTTVTTVDAAFDADGQHVKRLQTTENVSHWTTTEGSYYLRSSVLGGLVITEYGGGTPPKSYVYGDGDLIATRDHSGLLWRYNNPVTGDGRETDAQAKLAVAAYLDPGGMDAGASDPANAPYDPGQPPQPMAGAFGAHFPGSMGGSGSCTVDGVEMGCGFAYVLMGLGAAQCPDNNCNPRMTKYGLRPLILMMDQGFGFFANPQLKPAKKQTPKQREKAKREAQKRRNQDANKGNSEDEEPQKPKYPPVTASDINIVNWSKPFDRIGQQVVNDVIDIANNQRCSDALKKYHLRIPYDLVLSDKIRLVPSGFLYDDTAAHTLGISQELVESIRYDLSTGIIFLGDAAVTIGGPRPIIVIGPSATHQRSGGLKSVLIHEFIHAGGQPGRGSGKNGDLTYFDGYKEIQEACGGKSN